MKVGASTSCLYPLVTEKSLQKIIDLGFEKTEIFFNSISEIQPPFIKELKKQVDDANIEVLSVHPFSSFAESNCLFSDYERRFDDFCEWYRLTCNACAELGAKYVVIHGEYTFTKRPQSEEHYFDHFAKLIEIGKQEGATVCQENVVRFRSQSLEFLKKMRDYLGDDFNMVFDVKQAVRSGYDPLYVANEMKDSIVHLHLSDHNENNDCLPPGKGNFDFKKLLETVNTKSAVIELYSLGLDIENELVQSKNYFENL